MNFTFFENRAPQVDDEVLRVYIRPFGSDPDVDLKASLAGYVAVRGTWDVLDALNAMGGGAEEIVNLFEPSK
jgi:hypothetical protein